MIFAKLIPELVPGDGDYKVQSAWRGENAKEIASSRSRCFCIVGILWRSTFTVWDQAAGFDAGKKNGSSVSGSVQLILMPESKMDVQRSIATKQDFALSSYSVYTVEVLASFPVYTVERFSRMTVDAKQDFVVALDHAYTTERYFCETGDALVYANHK